MRVLILHQPATLKNLDQLACDGCRRLWQQFVHFVFTGAGVEQPEVDCIVI
jgi:hypothetical protein